MVYSLMLAACLAPERSLDGARSVRPHAAVAHSRQKPVDYTGVFVLQQIRTEPTHPHNVPGSTWRHPFLTPDFKVYRRYPYYTLEDRGKFAMHLASGAQKHDKD